VSISGIDASALQGIIDASMAVTLGGNDFAIFRSGQGNWYEDPSFDRNASSFMDAGALVGSYHVIEPSLRNSATREATLYFDRIRGFGLHLPPAIDVERFRRADLQDPKPLSVDEIPVWRAYMKEFAVALADMAGRLPLLYGSPFFLMPAVRDDEFLCGLPYWQADYNQIPHKAWRECVIHQYAGNGKCPGISVPVDMDRFAGSLDELKTFCGVLLPHVDLVKPSA
jgi:GH25 family lysozyme M1 (1,4-beta-N-acetylmuramidase)